MSALAPLLQGFFTDKLLRQRQASPNTVAAYRDTCRLLLEFAWRRTGIQPTQLDLSDLDASLITAFLQHLETERANTITTRNAGWRPSTPCSATRRCGHPNTPTRSAGYWASHPNAATAPSCLS